jgi:Spy/CpxP family protein refolding chaperone
VVLAFPGRVGIDLTAEEAEELAALPDEDIGGVAGGVARQNGRIVVTSDGRKIDTRKWPKKRIHERRNQMKEKLQKLTDEQKQELRALTTAEEVLAFAGRVGIDLTAEEADEITLALKLQKLTAEQKQELSALTTAEEVLAFAKRNGIDLTAEEADEITEALSDESLASVSGGAQVNPDTSPLKLPLWAQIIGDIITGPVTF